MVLGDTSNVDLNEHYNEIYNAFQQLIAQARPSLTPPNGATCNYSTEHEGEVWALARHQVEATEDGEAFEYFVCLGCALQLNTLLLEY